jgi:diguanylate cyclase
MALASQLSQAYDELRKQSLALSSFTVGRVDALTGIATSQAFDEQVAFHLKCQQSNNHSFSIAMLTVDLPAIDQQSRFETGRSLQNVAHLLQSSVRGHDFVARYGSEEFAVLLANTKLEGSNQFATRIRGLVKDQVGLSLSIGLAESRPDDEAKSLMARADSALYSARAGGGDRQYSHNGAAIRPHTEFLADTAKNLSTANSAGHGTDDRSTEEVEVSLDQLANVLVEAGA